MIRNCVWYRSVLYRYIETQQSQDPLPSISGRRHTRPSLTKNIVTVIGIAGLTIAVALSGNATSSAGSFVQSGGDTLSAMPILAVADAQFERRMTASDIGIGEAFFVPQTGPNGTIADHAALDDLNTTIATYVVRSGDTLSHIAQLYDCLLYTSDAADD